MKHFHSVCKGVALVAHRSIGLKVKLWPLFFLALNEMHVGAQRGEYFCNVPLRDYQFQYSLCF